MHHLWCLSVVFSLSGSASSSNEHNWHPVAVLLQLSASKVNTHKILLTQYSGFNVAVRMSY